MAGLRRICKQLGGMTVSNEKETVTYAWDKKADKPVVKKREAKK